MGEVSEGDLEKYAQEIFDIMMDFNVAVVEFRPKLERLSKKDSLYFCDALTKITKRSDRWKEVPFEYREMVIKVMYGRLASMKAELEI